MSERPEELNKALADLALAFYCGEPCRICGIDLTMDDMNNGAVYAGYSADSTSRAAHAECWQKYLDGEAELKP